MKILILFTLLLIVGNTGSQELFFTNKNASLHPPGYGCMIKNKLFPVGTRKQMNHEELKLYKEKTGNRASDGHAVMMECLYLVNPLHSDHPKPDDRVYVWVAS